MVLRQLHSPALLLCGFILSCGSGDEAHRPPETEGMVSRSYAVTDEVFSNPERGLMQFVQLDDPEDIDYVTRLGVSLGNARIRLDDFRDRALSAGFLDDLEAGLSDIRAAGLKLIVRFQYNAAPDGEDAPLSRMLEHIDQLTPVLDRNADVIATVQAGFIGAWGEWHGSTHGADDAEGRAAVLHALLDAMPADRMVQVRTPVYKDEIVPGGPVDESTAHDGSDLARVGHHNDCFLASENDDGTYPRPTEQWKDYVAADGRFVVVGGEGCRPNPPRSDCPTAEAELAGHHWSYLNGWYPTEIIDAWKTDGCFERIRRSLGYRLALRWARWTEAPAPGGELAVEVCLENLGYAAPYNPRPVVLVLDGDGGRIEVPAEVDPRRWSAGQLHVFNTVVPLPDDLAPGSYQLSLWLPDPAPALTGRADYAVRLANEQVWDADAGLNVLEPALVIGDP